MTSERRGMLKFGHSGKRMSPLGKRKGIVQRLLKRGQVGRIQFLKGCWCHQFRNHLLLLRRKTLRRAMWKRGMMMTMMTTRTMSRSDIDLIDNNHDTGIST